ncbi:MAG: PAS domain-containing protein [Myxococcota bacterium]
MTLHKLIPDARVVVFLTRRATRPVALLGVTLVMLGAAGGVAMVVAALLLASAALLVVARRRVRAATLSRWPVVQERWPHQQERVALFQVDADGFVTFANAGFLELVGWSEATAAGKDWLTAVHPADRLAAELAWITAAQEGREFKRQLRVVTPEGVVRRVWWRARAVVRSDGNVVSHLGTVEEVGSWKALDDGAAVPVSNGVTPPAPAVTTEGGDVDLNEVVGRMHGALRSLVGGEVGLVMALEGRLPPVRVARDEVERMVETLAVNARNAMPHGGTLTVTTFEVLLHDEEAAAAMGLNPGDYVVLSVSDSGPAPDGKTPGATALADEPSEADSLALVELHEAARSNGGNILVHAKPDGGATIEVFLPQAGAQPEQGLLPTQAEEPARVLLIEEDVEARELAHATLEAEGYQVVTVAQPADAIRRCQEQGAAPDLLVCNMLMPQMCGPELARYLMEGRPDMKVLFLQPGDRRISVLDDGAKVDQPAGVDALAAKVRQALAGPAFLGAPPGMVGAYGGWLSREPRKDQLLDG